MPHAHQLELKAIRRSWIDFAAAQFEFITYGLDRFTFDDLHPLLPKPEHVNWYGILAAKLKNEGVIHRVSAKPSKRPKANGRLIGVWEVV